ncbi:MAG: hypothetical protein HYT16_00290 [DPANN group archaeon]|nr:hypothetical protein [DPANN group archaeon]
MAVTHKSIARLVIFLLFIAASLTLVNFHQAQITGAPTGVTNVTVKSLVQITLVNDTVDLGVLQPGQFNNSFIQVAGRPGPFVINNSGNIDVNISISATALFLTMENTTNYQIRCGNASGATTPWGANCTDVRNSGTVNSTINSTGWFNLNISAPIIPNYRNLSFQTINQIFFHINVTIPPGEPIGNKTSTVTFTASAAI